MMDDGEKPPEFRGPTAAMVDFALTSLIASSVLLDGGGLVERASPAALTALDAGPDLLRGRPIDQLLGIDTAQLPLQHAVGPTAGVVSDADRVVHWRALDLGAGRDDGGWLVEFQVDGAGATTIEDRAQHLREIVDELADRRTRLDRHIGLISHDLQSPTRTLLSFVHFVRNELSSPPTNVARGLDSIERSARYLLLLTTELLQFSQLGSEPLDLELVDAQAVLDATLEQLAIELQDTGAHITVERPLPPVLASPTFLGVVFQNLIQNAIVYRRDDPPRVDITWTLDELVHIAVTDNGTGIPARQHDTVFQPGRRLVAGDVNHTGLGLSTAREIVERFGGTVEIASSEPGAGTTFVVSLRRATPGAPGSTETSST